MRLEVSFSTAVLLEAVSEYCPLRAEPCRVALQAGAPLNSAAHSFCGRDGLAGKVSTPLCDAARLDLFRLRFHGGFP